MCAIKILSIFHSTWAELKVLAMTQLVIRALAIYPLDRLGVARCRGEPVVARLRSWAGASCYKE
jgi:hypothetical protein